jgi:FKBP-type peptidyl-prolyl cis-trans isomerase SlyD
MVVEKDMVVTCKYDMYLSENGESEDLIEQATKERPLIYCHGEGMMLPKFEEAMEGLAVGAKFDFRIMHQDAYGDYDEAGRLELDKKIFYNGDDEFDAERVYVGAIVPMTTTDGQIVNAQVEQINDKTVIIDLNHPYAGADMHFVGEILDIRPVDPKELEAIRNPHKCGGCHGNCGDCSSDCGSSCGNCEK